MSADESAFKHQLSVREVRWLGERLTLAWSGFPKSRFIKAASAGLDALELKARARHIADALEQTLPAEPARAFAILVDSFDEPLTVTEGYGGSVFRYLPISEYLERHGPRDVDAALRANYELTKRFSSEFCIRPLILEAWPKVSKALSKWVRDADPHVRRLVSEGTRPRLPWGRQLRSFVEDPSPVLPFLEQLCDDDSEYVRRSVANNLNDIAKDHPDIVLDVARRWLKGASTERRRLVEHSLRTLLKRGDAEALTLIGAGEKVDASGSLSPRSVRLGDSVRFVARVKNPSKRPVHVVVEARVHFVKVKGTSPKPFRIARVDLGAGESLEVSKELKLVHRSIRRLLPGRHVVELQVNGVRSPMGAFTLRVD